MLMLHEDHAHEGASRDTIDTWHASLIPTGLFSRQQLELWHDGQNLGLYAKCINSVVFKAMWAPVSYTFSVLVARLPSQCD